MSTRTAIVKFPVTAATETPKASGNGKANDDVIAVGGAKPFILQELPDPSWSQDQLVEGARYQWRQIQAAEKKVAVHVFRLGAALAILKPSLKKRRGWGKFIKGLHLSEATAWRAMELFTRAKTENQVASLPITEAYEQFGIIQATIPADDDDVGNNAAETGGKKKAAANKGKKPSPAHDDVEDEQIESHGDDLEDNDADSNDDGEQDDDGPSLVTGPWKLPRFAQKNDGKDEFYTPDSAIALLLPYLPKGKVIWESAWGMGHIARYLESHGHTVVGGPDVDFLTENIEAQILVTNPPYSKKDKFLLRAYEIGKPFAMLLAADALVGMERYPLFAKHGLQLLIPNKRINFICANGFTANFSTFWYCWKLLPQDFVFAELTPDNGEKHDVE